MLRRHFKSFRAIGLSCMFYITMGSKIGVKNVSDNVQYDIAVIGGGSGGLSAAFQASKHGLKVIVIDYVDPSPNGTKWGIGGTCVNVGCIPKKLMHQAAKYSQHIVDAQDYGLSLPGNINSRSNLKQVRKHFQWDKLKSAVVSYIKSMNFGYLSTINQLQNVTYLNCMATFVDQNTLLCSKQKSTIQNYVSTGTISPNSEHQIIKAHNVIIATGTRPKYLNIPGEQFAITSDDIFFKKQAPNKTLVVGGGYVAVEIAGILACLGYPVTLMTRGQYLREFDRDMVHEILTDLKKRQVNIVPTSLPTKIHKNGDSFQVTIKNQQNGQQNVSTFDTVLMAVGRFPTTALLNLQKVGVKVNREHKIITQKEEIEKTSINNIYAIGDVVEGVPQLTSTVTKVGGCLGRRIAQKMGKGKFKESEKKISLANFPTTIFTPLEYSTCGLSEQNAIKKYSKEGIEVYHLKFTPLEENLLMKYDEEGNSTRNMSYMKAIVHISDGKVIGLHYCGPNAGQIMQGFAAAIRVGITKDQLDTTIGIHPTIAESFTELNISKSSGLQFIKTSC